jgi:hypothetical protein
LRYGKLRIRGFPVTESFTIFSDLFTNTARSQTEERHSMRANSKGSRIRKRTRILLAVTLASAIAGGAIATVEVFGQKQKPGASPPPASSAAGKSGAIERGRSAARALMESGGAEAARSPLVSKEELVKAGLSEARAEHVQQHVVSSQKRMQELAASLRSGEIDGRKYSSSVADLGQSARTELGTDGYDWVLYAGGVPNRIVVQDAPPPELLGGITLLPGDVLISYDGERVYRPADLARLSRSGQRGAPVVLEYSRKGQVLRATVPRGPLGPAFEMRLEPPSAPVTP